MPLKERVIHMILFELFALSLFVPLAIYVTGKSLGLMTGLSITMSLIAMLWNFSYNWFYDSIRGDDRLSRTLTERILHGVGFEFGMVAASFPILMYVLQERFLTVLIMNIGAVLFFLLYAIAFNWIYDVVRHKYFK